MILNEGIFIHEEKSRINLKLDMEEELIPQIEHKANTLLEEMNPYEYLCLKLAENQLIYQKGCGSYSEKDIFKKFKEIYYHSPEYHELCWQIAKLEVFFAEKSVVCICI